MSQRDRVARTMIMMQPRQPHQVMNRPADIQQEERMHGVEMPPMYPGLPTEDYPMDTSLEDFFLRMRR